MYSYYIEFFFLFFLNEKAIFFPEVHYPLQNSKFLPPVNQIKSETPLYIILKTIVKMS